MAAPEYVPPSYADQPRASLPLPPNRRWTANRPGDFRGAQPLGRGLGSPGPDQGYAYRLARLFEDNLSLTEGEHKDVVAGAVAVALGRASLFGRAPVRDDLALAFSLFGFLDDNVPEDLVEWRKRVFRGAHHDYWEQRQIVDLIPELTLRMKPDEVRSRLSEWKTLVGAAG
ncbi:MAG: hypothetical protein ACRD2W_25490 [Acidimicrobiales bacterium]